MFTTLNIELFFPWYPTKMRFVAIVDGFVCPLLDIEIFHFFIYLNSISLYLIFYMLQFSLILDYVHLILLSFGHQLHFLNLM